MKYILSLFLFTFLPGAHAQDISPLIDQLASKMSKVKDYSVDAYIRSDIPLVRILPVRATIYFKQKDKFRIKSKGIAILPRQGFTDLSTLIEDKRSFTSIPSGNEIISGINTEIITLLPASDTSDLILSRLWIDPVRVLVLKSQITTRTNGTVSIEYFHHQSNSFGLPDSMVFTVDVKKFKIPKGVATDINRSSSNEEKKPVSKNGRVFIGLKNYLINKGIDDSVFNK